METRQADRQRLRLRDSDCGWRGRGGRPKEGRGRRSESRSATSGNGGSTVAGRTATRALIAVGAYVAQDLRDAEGLTRPLLRRAALRLSLSPQAQLRQLGSAYLRLDPPSADDFTARPSAVERAPASRLGLPAPDDDATASSGAT